MKKILLLLFILFLPTGVLADAVLPDAINLHTTSWNADPLKLVTINSPTSTSGTKPAGNLPISSNSAQYQSNVVGTTKGLAYNIPSSVDVSENTKIIVWAWQFNAPNRIQTDSYANEGIIARLYSDEGSSNYREFVIGGNDKPSASSQAGALTFILDPNGNGYSSETGTFNLNNFSGYAFANKRLNLQGGSTSFVFFTRAFLFGTAQDSDDIPRFIGDSDYDDIILEVLGSDYTTKIHTFVSKAGSTYTLLNPFAIGYASQGSNTTNFNDNGATVLSPSNNDISNPIYQLSDQAMRVHLDLNSSDNATFSGTYIWGTQADFNFNSSVGANVTLNNPTFNGIGRFFYGEDISGSVTITKSKRVELYTNQLSDLTVSNSNDVLALHLTKVSNVSDSTISGAHNGILIDNAGSYTFEDVTFSSNDNDILLNHTGEVNITLINTDVPSINNTGVGTYNLIRPVNIEILGLEGTETVRIYNENTSETLFNQTLTNSTFSLETNYNGDVQMIITVREDKKKGEQYNVTLDNDGISLTISLEDDLIYGEMGVNGSSVTGLSIQKSPLEILMNVSSNQTTIQEIYTWWIYETAKPEYMDVDLTSFRALTNVEVKSFNDLKFKNINSDPLTITGGNVQYNGGIASDIVNAGGSIIVVSSTVVSFASSESQCIQDIATLKEVVKSGNDDISFIKKLLLMMI